MRNFLDPENFKRLKLKKIVKRVIDIYLKSVTHKNKIDIRSKFLSSLRETHLVIIVLLDDNLNINLHIYI